MATYRQGSSPTVLTDLEVDDGTLSVDQSNNRLGILTTSPATTLDVNGAATVRGNATVTGDLILDDGGSIKEAGGTAAITIDASGEITKIGQDTPSTNEVLTWNGSKWVAAAVSAVGDIEGVTAGNCHQCGCIGFYDQWG